MNDFGFVSSRSVIVAAMVLAAATLIVAASAEKKRVTLLRLFGISGSARGLGAVALAAALIVLGIARPYYGVREERIPTMNRDVIFILDVSLSMLVSDVSPTRLEFAKRKIIDSLGVLGRNRSGDRVGVILFAGDAYLYCPPTVDYGVAKQFIQSISPSFITSRGSRLDRALGEARRTLDSTKSASALLVLMSDGAAGSQGAPVADPALLRAPLHVIGIGTPDGGPIEYQRSRFLHDASGSTVISKLDEDSLGKLASTYGGTYHRATLGDEDLEKILAPEIAVPQAADGEDSAKPGSVIRIHHELGPFVIWVFLGLLFVDRLRRRPTILAAFLLAFVAPRAFAEDAPLTARQSYEAYESGSYDAAAAGFAEALKLDPANPRLKQALASALFKSGKVPESEKLFEELAETARTGREVYESKYNLGNALLSGRKYEDAIKRYDEALAVRPDDAAASENRALAARLLEEKKKQEEQQQKDGKNDDEKDSDDTKEKKEQKDGKDSDKQKGDEQDDKNESGEKDDTKPDENGNDKQNPGERDDDREDEGKEKDSPNPSDGGTPTPKPAAAATARPTANPSGENGKTGSSAPKGASAEELREAQARSWLESLADAPVLLRRKSGKAEQEDANIW